MIPVDDSIRSFQDQEATTNVLKTQFAFKHLPVTAATTVIRIYVREHKTKAKRYSEDLDDSMEANRLINIMCTAVITKKPIRPMVAKNLVSWSQS